ncbi:MAG TPA: arsenate reductase ArsC, partial [Methanoregulaceae archaeon]|nr:arsenate reductase ArsC [Methanoregulaceae archaeon]
HPIAIEVREEVAIDISGQQSKTLNTFLGESFDIVVTVCDPAQGSCPFFPGATRLIHRSFSDPS